MKLTYKSFDEMQAHSKNKLKTLTRKRKKIEILKQSSSTFKLYDDHSRNMEKIKSMGINKG